MTIGGRKVVTDPKKIKREFARVLPETLIFLSLKIPSALLMFQESGGVEPKPSATPGK
jgi:hypothetical protein